MDIQLVKDEAHAACVVIFGRMDSGGVQAATDRFRQLVIAPGKNVVLDMSEVDFMASVGMRLMIEAHKTLGQNGATLVVAAPQELVAEGLKIAGIDKMLPVVASVDEAMARLG